MWLPTGRLHQLLERGAAGPFQQVEHLGRFAAMARDGSLLKELCGLFGFCALLRFCALVGALRCSGLGFAPSGTRLFASRLWRRSDLFFWIRRHHMSDFSFSRSVTAVTT